MTASSPRGYEERPAVRGDLDAVVDLHDIADAALGVAHDPNREWLTWLWRLSWVDLDRDTRLALDGDTVVGFAQATWNPDEGGPLHLFVRIHPDHQGAGLGTAFVAWAETLADERGAEGIRAETVDVDAAAHDLLQARGYRQVRSFFTMWKGLRTDEDPGTAPDGVTIRSYEDADERALFDVHEASFADHWEYRPDTFEVFNEAMHGDDWDPSLVFLAEADGEVVGHVVSYLFEHQGYVASLGVVKPWRGRGIATALLRRAFAAFASRDMRDVQLGVDGQNPHGAVALYKGVGMTVLRRFDLFDLGTAEAAGNASPS